MSTSTTPTATIRDATPDDLAVINDIYNFYVLTSTATFDIEPLPLEERRRWYEEHGEHYPVVVAEAGGEVIGWCSLSSFRTRPAYRWTAEDSVYIADAWRGRGIGRLLLAEVMGRAKTLGYHAVIARIGDSANIASCELHRNMGFELVGIEREVGYKFARWLDVVVMQWSAPQQAKDR